MSKLFVVLLLAVAGQSFADSVTDGTKLISTILMHRHGDRTPISSSAALSTDPDAVEAASAPYGYGQLTDVGKRRAYALGQTIRERYDELLSPQYNKSEIYIRSTDSTRAKMTILSALAAIYPAYSGSWSDEVNWVPTPYTTVPAKYDFNLFNMNCPNYLTGYYTLAMSNPSSMDKYFDTLNIVAAASGSNMTSVPVMGAYAFYDVYASQESLGVALSDEIAAIMPDLKEAAAEAIDIFLGNDDYLLYEGGPILNEFFTQADDLIAGTDTQRVRIHSAHDITVYGFEAAAHVYPRQGVPAYTGAFALELRQVEATAEYVVLATYQASPGEGWVYLTADGCDTLCPYDTYKELVSAYTSDEDTWRTECGFTDDLVVDDSSIA
nr:acid phosphatase [Ectropis obliqua]